MNAAAGSSLDNLTRCSAGIFDSVGNSTPQSFANHQWLQSVRVFANGTVAGLVHNEFKGDMEGGPYCSKRSKHGTPACEIWSTGAAVSVNGGGKFKLVASPPHHLVAALPYTFLKDEPTAGYGAFWSDFHRFNYFKLVCVGHIQAQGAVFSRTHLKLADMVLTCFLNYGQFPSSGTVPSLRCSAAQTARSTAPSTSS